MEFRKKLNFSITFNGRTFGSADEMPPDVRREYDGVLRNLHGDPDALPPGGVTTETNVQTKVLNIQVRSGPEGRKILFNGREYASPESLPPEGRRVYEKAMAAIQRQDTSQVSRVTEALSEAPSGPTIVAPYSRPATRSDETAGDRILRCVQIGAVVLVVLVLMALLLIRIFGK